MIVLGPECKMAEASASIKCAYWFEALDGEEGKNTGYKLFDFEIAIAGCNWYNKREGVKGDAEMLRMSWFAMLGLAMLAWMLL